MSGREKIARSGSGLLFVAGLLAVGVALGGAAIAGGAEDLAHRLSAQAPAATRPLALRASISQANGPPGLTVDRGRIVGGSGGMLAAQPIGPLMGWLAPVAVSSPDGREFVYSTWHALREDDPRFAWSEQGIRLGDAIGEPALRRFDLRHGTDSLVERGAFSAAWRADGALAYLRGAEPAYRAGERYVGDVVVRRSASAPAVVWSETADRYVVAAWAGNTLLAYRLREGEWLDLVAFDGPQRQRTFAENTALVAVSPDGRSVFVSDGSQRPASVRVLAVANGRELARKPLGTIAGVEVPSVGYAGSWAGDTVAAGTDAGLVTFRVGPSSIEPDTVLRLDPRLFPHGAVEPVFVDGRVVMRADLATGSAGDTYPTVLLDCDLGTGTCARGEPAAPHDWLRLVSNPSRPKTR